MDVAEFQSAVADPAHWNEDHAAVIRGYYDLVSDIYANAWGELQHFPVYRGEEDSEQAARSTVQRLADRGAFKLPMRVLDIGCGVGGPALAIAQYSGVHVTGIDLVGHRVETARALAADRGLLDHTTFVVGDMMDLPFEDASFDAVYSLEAICHAPEKGRAYREVARVLKPGGVFLGHDWLRGMDSRDVEAVLRCHAIPSLLTLAELREQLTSAGLAVAEVVDLGEGGSLSKNWDLMEQMAGVELPDDAPGILRMMARGGTALSRAARTGSFLIGYWEARKPDGQH